MNPLKIVESDGEDEPPEEEWHNIWLDLSFNENNIMECFSPARQAAVSKKRGINDAWLILF